MQERDLLQAASRAEIVVSQALAQLELAQGHFDQAEQAAYQALAVIEYFHCQPLRGEMLTILAQVAFARRAFALAEAFLAQALPFVWKFGFLFSSA